MEDPQESELDPGTWALAQQQVLRGQGSAGPGAEDTGQETYMNTGQRGCTPALYSCWQWGSRCRLLNGGTGREWGLGAGFRRSPEEQTPGSGHPTCYQHGHVLRQAARRDACQLGEEAGSSPGGPWHSGLSAAAAGPSSQEAPVGKSGARRRPMTTQEPRHPSTTGGALPRH